MKIAIIPARKGSKRIPDKNIKDFAGRPIITYSIEAAKKSALFDRIVVSTDSKKIADIAIKAGAEIPFMRPLELSDDMTGTTEVLVYTLKRLKKKGLKIEYACQIYATAPFVTAEHLRKGFDILKEYGAKAVLAVTTSAHSVFRSLKKEDDGSLKSVWAQYQETRSNDLPETYHDAGQFVWVNVNSFLKQGKIYGANLYPMLIPRYMVQDIDTHEDWKAAEIMYDVC